jgi:hypothetical protein
MKIPVWVLSTCSPEEGEPCRPQVFADESAARAAFDASMRDEWKSNAPDDEHGAQVEYPGNPEEAVRLIREAAGREWGTWELTRHEVDVAIEEGSVR